MATSREADAFDRALPGLLSDPENVGKYALVHGDAVDSVWPTFEEALAQGYERFDLDTFIVRHIVEREEPIYFSHKVSPCR